MYPLDPLNPFQIATPQFMPQMQIPQPTNIKYVSGKQGVESHQMAANSSDIFLDSSEKKFYTKVTDANGNPTIKCFDYTESEEDKPVEYVTKAEFDAFKAKMKGAKNESNVNARKQSNSHESSGGDDAR